MPWWPQAKQLHLLEGMVLAAEAIDSGRALQQVEKLAALTNMQLIRRDLDHDHRHPRHPEKNRCPQSRKKLLPPRLAVPITELKSRIRDLEEVPRGFERHLREAVASDWTAIIAEVKKGSPSKGVIRADFDPLEIAEIYQNNGATCLSVLTDEHFFLGHLRYLALIRETVSLPLLRKDFICDPYQIYEARAAGADAILLIAAMLDLNQLREFHAMAREIHLDVLLEVHDEAEMETGAETRLQPDWCQQP